MRVFEIFLKHYNTCLKLNVQKTKIMASGPVTSWQIAGETMETVRDYFGGFQNHCRVVFLGLSHLASQRSGAACKIHLMKEKDKMTIFEKVQQRMEKIVGSVSVRLD